MELEEDEVKNLVAIVNHKLVLCWFCIILHQRIQNWKLRIVNQLNGKNCMDDLIRGMANLNTINL